MNERLASIVKRSATRAVCHVGVLALLAQYGSVSMLPHLKANFFRSRRALQVKTLTPKYFPAVEPDAVVFVTSRVPVRLLRPGTWVDGAIDRNVRTLARLTDQNLLPYLTTLRFKTVTFTRTYDDLLSEYLTALRF